jgi:hypothetical protein
LGASVSSRVSASRDYRARSCLAVAGEACRLPEW